MSPMHTQPDAATTWLGLQGLRGVAASLVVAMHASLYLAQQQQGLQTTDYWSQGGFGVHIFFVISGFVMGWTAPTPWVPSSETGSAWQAAWRFLLRRLIRLVPLYWAFVALKLVLMAALPGSALREMPTTEAIVASFLFWPQWDRAGQFFPVLQVGWTLNLEMAFYLLYALAIGLRQRALWWCSVAWGLCLLAAPLVGPEHPLQFWSRTVFAEFLFGLVLALVWRLPQMQRGPSWVAALGGLGCWALWWTQGLPAAWDDTLRQGLPAVGIVAATLALEPIWRRLPWANALQQAGDASYALYLVHTLAVPVLVKLLIKVGLTQPVWAVTLSLLCVWPLALLIHRGVERPVLRALRQRLRA